MKATVIARTFPAPNKDDKEYLTLTEETFKPEYILRSNKIMAGKAAGICYMPDNYLSEGIQNEDKALKRAEGTAKSGHYSTYEHGHVTFLIECNKIMAMILNSTRLYSTSEKSGRYTVMKATSELEEEMYSKWRGIFTELISVYSKNDNLTEKEIDKLAMENARYMLGIFVPTVMEFTVPFNRAVLLSRWLYDLGDFLVNSMKYYCKEENENNKNTWVNTYEQIGKDCLELSDEISTSIGINNIQLNDFLSDHKNMGIEFLDFPYFVMGLKKAKVNEYDIHKMVREYDFSDNHQAHYGDNYSSLYRSSLACLADLERHRTLSYTISNFELDKEPYIPNLIYNTPYHAEWLRDYKKLVEAGIVPQCTMVDISERGRFEDFFAKCKERLCCRAYLEVTRVTQNQVKRFLVNGLNKLNSIRLDDMFNSKDGIVEIKPRCMFTDFKCREVCKICDKNLDHRIY